MERIEVFYSGHVQGVGFRENACRHAAALPITGTVKNLPQGDVRLIAEGERADLQELLRRIEKSMEGNIRRQTVDWQVADGRLSKFRIEH